MVLTEAELEAARARRLAAEEAFRKIELEKKKQVSSEPTKRMGAEAIVTKSSYFLWHEQYNNRKRSSRLLKIKPDKKLN